MEFVIRTLHKKVSTLLLKRLSYYDVIENFSHDIDKVKMADASINYINGQLQELETAITILNKYNGKGVY